MQKAVIVGFTPKMVKVAHFSWRKHWLMEKKYNDIYKRDVMTYILDSGGNLVLDPNKPPELGHTVSIVQSGPTLLIWPGEDWEELIEAKKQGLLDEV